MAALAAQTPERLTAQQAQQAQARVRVLAAVAAQQARQEQVRPRVQVTVALAELRAAVAVAGPQG